MWVPPEDKDPIQYMAPVKKNTSLFGGVNADTGKFVSLFEKTFDADSFKRFLRKLLKSRRKNKRMLLVLDNARYHHAVLLKPFLHKHRNHLSLIFLPSYSPELNAIERVWKLLRRLSTHNRYFESLELLKNAIKKQLRFWYRPNQTLIKLCRII